MIGHRGFYIVTAQRAERAGRDTHHTPATTGRVDRWEVAAFILDDGTGFADRPCLARGARLADMHVNTKDGTHGSVISHADAARNPRSTMIDTICAWCYIGPVSDRPANRQTIT
jgi:hypothetical protein